ncbi:MULTISPECIES: hypothetical protein [unclassified Sphingomonas]|uniref:hypothetical protein n=1 Tax=unclassified Sphingomonas TaxID=196159 RepID=UPI0008355A28|nr:MULTISPECIES: hypothetical protein [unclassified Sphingomonas]
MRDLIATLPQVDADDADRRNRLLGALNGWVVDDGVVRARIVGPPGALCDWVICGNGAAIGFDRHGGAPCGSPGVDGVAAVELIDRFEPLLALIERALGIAIDPERVDPRPPAGGLPVELATLDARRGVADRLWLIVPQDLALLAATGPFASPLAAHVTLDGRLHFPGPRLSPLDAAELGAGDLVLIGAGPFDAVLDADGVPPCRGRFDPGTRVFTPTAFTQGVPNGG